MNYKQVKHFFPSASGNCSLTWQWDWAQTLESHSWGNILCGDSGCAKELVHSTSAVCLNVVPKYRESSHGCAWCQACVGPSCWSRWVRITSSGSRGEDWGRVRQGMAFLAFLLPCCTGRMVPNTTCTIDISYYSCFCKSGTIPLKPVAPR